ncbi:MAG TPA: hypothetical protein VNY83_02535 [Solirubrobacterales bacterium]|jgi:hypothetical protein|nr:hypothetical protein [Solirubrobacterales bacterium]
MKFLITVTPKEVTLLPPNVAAEILSAQRDWLKQKVDDGTLDYAYGFVTGGGCGIANAGSAEEINALILDAPAFAIGNYEVRPLGDVGQTLDAAVRSLERAASMMPT